MNTKAKLAAGTLAAATVFIVAWEGNKTKPYLDVGGIPTACAGVTKGIDFSRIYTAEECAAMNAREIEAHAADVLRCVSRETSEPEKIALVSFAYNVGATQACGSTLMAKLNRGEYYCAELLRWDRVGSKQIRGLTNRRVAEKQLCDEGFKSRTVSDALSR